MKASNWRLCVVLAVALISALCPSARAADDATEPTRLRVVSPNGKREVTTWSGKGVWEGILVRDVASGKIIDRRSTGIDGVDGEVTKVIWSPKSTGFMIELDGGRFTFWQVFRITDKGAVTMHFSVSPSFHLPEHQNRQPFLEHQFPSGGEAILDWPDENHFRMRSALREPNSEHDCEITYRIHRRNRVTIDKVVDLLEGMPPPAK